MYDKNHASGSSYYDLEILQTPLLEAFTDNAAMLKYNLVTYSNLEFLFLPVMLLNQSNRNQQMNAAKDVFYVCANGETEDDNGGNTTFNGVGIDSSGQLRQGFLFGSGVTKGGSIQADQGLNTTQLSPVATLDPELNESTYIVQMDSRLGNLADVNGNVMNADYIDDDDISYYTITEPSNFVRQNQNKTTGGDQVIQGPRGSMVSFKLQASMNLQTSSYLFLQLGGTEQLDNRATPAGKSTVYYIDTTVKITGVGTGCSINIPIRYIRLA